MQFFLLLFLGFGLIGISISEVAFAQSSYDVNIPTGAASPDAPYFWQSEKDGSTTGIIEIIVGDEIVWKNADSAAHTVTSGTPEAGPDDLFDSALFAPGKSFSYTFNEKGNFPYYCIVHPWMVGNVIVTEGYRILPDVGKNIGDGLTTFDIEYDFNRLLSTASINEDEKSITFEIIGNAKSNDHTLSIRLPSALIDGPFAIWVDGKKISDFEFVKDNDLNIVDISLDSDSQLLTIIGTSVVPEFGVMTMAILGISIFSILFFSKRLSLRFPL